MEQVMKSGGFASWQQVTEHYGYVTRTSYTGETYYVVYGRTTDGIFDSLATCDRDTVVEAIEECKYYERYYSRKYKKKGEER